MKMTKYKTMVFIIILFSVTYSGCSSKFVAGRGYEGPELPKEKVAVIRGDSLGRFVNNQSINICKVDGNIVNMDPKLRSVDVLPGLHTVKVLYDGGKVLNALELTFNAEAGHQYLITFEKKGVWKAQVDQSFIVWIEDVNTKDKIKDATASPLQSPFSCF